MLQIPEELREQATHGKLLLFIGERILRDAQGQVVYDQIAAHLAAQCILDNGGPYALPEVAQVFEDMHGRPRLVQVVREQLTAAGVVPQPVHDQLARLMTGLVVITTCLDCSLEQALAARQHRIQVIVTPDDEPADDETALRLYKLRGTLERDDALLLTRNDYEAFEDSAPLAPRLRGHLAGATILFLGYDLADSYVQRLYRTLVAPLDPAVRCVYALCDGPPTALVRNWCHHRGITLVEADLPAFLQALSHHLAAHAPPPTAAPSANPDTPLPTRPYKLLDYYTPTDAVLFFGRQQETHDLAALIHAHRLVLVYGASGVGKTSLLLAGVKPHLERTNPAYLCLYVRALDDSYYSHGPEQSGHTAACVGRFTGGAALY